MTEFDSNTFEHDYICAQLEGLVPELKIERDPVEIIDKYACSLTAFMSGRIRAEVKRVQEENRLLVMSWGVSL